MAVMEGHMSTWMFAYNTSVDEWVKKHIQFHRHGNDEYDEFMLRPSNDHHHSNVSSVTTNHTTVEMFDTGLMDVIGIWVTGAVCLVGLVGNMVSFVALLKAHGKSPMVSMLRALAVSDMLFLLCVFIMQTLVNIGGTDGGPLEYVFRHRGYIQFVLWPVLMVSQMTTVWLTVLMSVERFIAVCCPFRVKMMCTKTNIHRSLYLTYALAVLFNVPRYFEHDIVDNHLMKNRVGSNIVYRYVYTASLYSLCLFFIPFGLIIFLNVRIVYELMNVKRILALRAHQRREHNLTLIPLTIMVVFLICCTPSLVYNIIDAVYPTVSMQYHLLTFMVVANLLIVLNSATNFIIYCLLGKKFRYRLMQMCCCCPRKHPVVERRGQSLSRQNSFPFTSYGGRRSRMMHSSSVSSRRPYAQSEASVSRASRVDCCSLSMREMQRLTIQS